MIASQSKAIGLARLEPPAEAINRRKATVKKTKNRPLRSVATKGTIPENSLNQNYPRAKILKKYPTFNLC